jgi:hypothetical protein
MLKCTHYITTFAKRPCQQEVGGEELALSGADGRVLKMWSPVYTNRSPVFCTPVRGFADGLTDSIGGHGPGQGGVLVFWFGALPIPAVHTWALGCTYLLISTPYPIYWLALSLLFLSLTLGVLALLSLPAQWCLVLGDGPGLHLYCDILLVTLMVLVADII